jgi:hypothetical protein
MLLHPVQAALEKRATVCQLRLTALTVGGPFDVFGREQQVQVVVARQQLIVKPCRVVAEQGLAPEFVGEQVGVEDQQPGLRCTRGVFPGQLAEGDVRNVRQAGVALMRVDEIPHVFADHQATEVRVQLSGEPAFAAGFGARQYHHLHVRNAGSARHSRQPCTAITVNSA